jgi:hypothetical protein
MGSPPSRTALRFGADADPAIREHLSSVLRIGDELWLGSDEGTTLERLAPTADGYGDHRSFPIHDFLDLPGGADSEVDVEGLAYDDGWLWVIGSHSARRRKLRADDDDVAAARHRFAEVARDPNRYLLARVPMVRGDDGRYQPVARTEHGSDVRRAARLPGSSRRAGILRALRDDEHLAPFFDIPGKDNGFDIEGLAVDGDRVFVGLRGPVLRGWSTVLTFAPRPRRRRADRLRLRRIGAQGRRYHKHFLDLRGLGVRELCADGRDLLVVAGPTMALDGRATVFRWRHGLDVETDAIVRREELDVVVELPYGAGDHEGTDHPEGICVVERDGARYLLVVYDSPSDERRAGEHGVLADLYPLT